LTLQYWALGLLLALPAAAQTGKSATVLPRDATQFLQEKKLALIIGINDYQEESGLSKLKYAINDANDLAKALQVYGYTTDVLTDSRALRVTIRRHLEDMLKRVDPNSGTLLFAFSGHGGKADGADYLATYDAAADSIAADGIAVNWIKNQLAASNAARKIMFLDACRSVATPNGKEISAPVEPFARLSESKGLRMLISTAEGTRSYEDDKLKHGLFTHYVVTGLRGSAAGPDGLITFNRLSDYVTANVKESRPDQVPYTDGQYSGDFYLGGDFKAVPPVSAAPPLNMDLERYNAVKESHDPSLLEREAAKLQDPELAELLRLRAESMRSQGDSGQTAPTKPATEQVDGLRKRADSLYDRSDFPAAYSLYQQLASLADPWGMFRLGRCLAFGLGVAKDPKNAVVWYRKAADAGERNAMNNLGAMYEGGDGVAKDYLQAIAWYHKAADAGASRAMTNLGDIYANGNGVPKDYSQAVVWYRKAANAGDTRAMADLGLMYELGNGVGKDYGQAVNLYRKSAEGAYPPGMFCLAGMYEYGRGVAADREKAVFWYQKAAAAGSREGRAALDRLGR
jgi:TPR repeat protein